MTPQKFEIEASDLPELLEKLEEISSERRALFSFVLVVPRKGEDVYVKNYVWVGQTKPKYACQKWICTGSQLSVAARNYTLSKYTVRFTVSADGSGVKLRKDSNGLCTRKFSDEIFVPPHPPHFSPGPGVARTCEILVESKVDPTATLTFTRDILNERLQPWRVEDCPGSIVVDVTEGG
jgi:hypothetical protein